MSPLSRRSFFKSSSVAAAGAMLLPAAARAGRGSNILVPSGGHWVDPDRYALATTAVDAARAAGASYADVRLSHMLGEFWTDPYPSMPGGNEEKFGVGVRALVNGYWGFFGSALWTPDEMVRLARGAVVQAKANSLGRMRERPLAPTPVVTGEWVMPVKYDPFEVSWSEKYDFFNHAAGLLRRYGGPLDAGMKGKFYRTDTVFASSEGSSWKQTVYSTDGAMAVMYDAEPGYRKYESGQAYAAQLTPSGQGWEFFIESGLLESIPELIDRADEERDRTSVDVGRYDLVCSASATAALLKWTVGEAAELDRALGFEANASGTSYLDQPLEMLGAYTVGSKLLNVTANRSQPGGLATVKWDDEGVEPEEYTFVKDGVLVDYHTTREQVAWLAPYYEKTGRAMRSHGCARTENASQIPMQSLPNLQMMPGAQATNLTDLLSGITKGIALVDVGPVLVDQQRLTATVLGSYREIRNGKFGRFVDGAALTFRAPEFWKSLDAIGGAASTRWSGYYEFKGQPPQFTQLSVGAVPARFKNAGIIDYTRKA